jgi:hypothetical protein
MKVTRFHHVLLELTDAPNKPRCVFFDLSERELKTRFVKPYRKGKNILCGNEVIRVENIRRVQIIRTDQTMAVELDVIKTRSRKWRDDFNRRSDSLVFLDDGLGYDLEDIAEAGEDVAPRHIVGPPGHAASGVLRSFLNNGWVKTIGTGLILAYLLWRFGLK